MKGILWTILTISVSSIAPTLADTFEYRKWTNQEGNAFKAKIERLNGEELTLKAEKGGKRHTIKRAVLSDDSEAMLARLIDEAKAQLQAIKGDQGGPVPGELVARAVALGLKQELLQVGPRHAKFTICDIRVDKRLTAYIEFTEGCFKEIRAKSGYEFFIKDKTLYVRTSAKGDPDHPYRSTKTDLDEGASQVVRIGAPYAISIHGSTIIDWDRIGVTDAPVFR